MARTIKLSLLVAAVLALAGCARYTQLPDGTKIGTFHEYDPKTGKIQFSQNIVDGGLKFAESATDRAFNRTTTAAKELAPKNE